MHAYAANAIHPQCTTAVHMRAHTTMPWASRTHLLARLSSCCAVGVFSDMGGRAGNWIRSSCASDARAEE
eukprot:359953-Chlamydomonas_euryale.AAC.3